MCILHMNILKKYREIRNINITQASKALGIERSYLSKVEHKHIRPSLDLLRRLIELYSIPETELAYLYAESGYGTGKEIIINQKEGREMLKMDKNQNSNEAQVSVPTNTPILYCDSIFITKSDFGLVFDFAQKLGPTNKHTVVSRIGMSKEHAEAFLRILADQIKEKKVDVMKKVVRA